MPPRRDGDTTTWVDTWETFAEQQVRQSIERGEFDSLPGAGKPLDLGQANPFEGDSGPAHRLARNAGVVPRWVEIGHEVDECLAVLESLLHASQRGPALPTEALLVTPSAPDGWRAWLHRLWFGPPRPTRAITAIPAVHAREVARARYMDRAAYADERIRAFNAQLPRGLAWLERAPVTPDMAAARFDHAWPPATTTRNWCPSDDSWRQAKLVP